MPDFGDNGMRDYGPRPGSGDVPYRPKSVKKFETVKVQMRIPEWVRRMRNGEELLDPDYKTRGSSDE